ncbi:hypothetical protein K438DRAFT_423660 [Mycena galopus ATCC 62051]|nr:hypothetical protein K438DRAFT_423660 [Mycena galopus ATCC 62051]
MNSARPHVPDYCREAVKAPGLEERVFKAANWKTPYVKAATKPAEMNAMLVIRALANVAQEGSSTAEHRRHCTLSIFSMFELSVLFSYLLVLHVFKLYPNIA